MVPAHLVTQFPLCIGHQKLASAIPLPVLGGSLETSTWTVSRGVAEMMVRERLRRTATLMLRTGGNYTEPGDCLLI